MNVKIEKIKLNDCSKVTKVVTRCWRETYQGIINQDFLDNLLNNEEERTKRLINNFGEEKNHYLVLKEDEKVIGFVRYDEARDFNYLGYGEITALYILKEYQGLGYGRKLVENAMEELRKKGFQKMIIGCLAGNKSNNFYKHLGGIFQSKRIFTRTNEEKEENVYVFDI